MRIDCLWVLATTAVLAQGCSNGAPRALDFFDGSFGGRDSAGPAFDGGLPPENEVDVRFEPPAVGASVLYATNAGAGRVAVIHADDFSIETVGVGASPLPAVAAPGRDLAVSLDRGSSTVSILRTTETGTTVSSLPIDHDANEVAFDPTGAFAVLFEGPRPGMARRNFQDASVLALTDGAERMVRVVVGYGPSHVEFDPAGTRAFVVTEDGVSLIDLAALPAEGPIRAPLLGFDTLERLGETRITPDGTFALARVGVSEIRQLDLRDGTVVVADLASLAPGETIEITDLDVLPSGTELVAVVRSHGAVVRMPIGATFADSTAWALLDMSAEPVGSLAFSSAGNLFVSYTTDPDVEAIAIVDLDLGEVRRVGLRKSVRALAISPDGHFAIALHHAIARSGDDEDALVDRSEGYSLIDLTTGFARLSLVDAEPAPDALVLDASSGRLMIALRDDARGIHELQVVDLATFAVDRVPLVAPPTTVGVFPALDRAFVGQEADGGRVTFYLWGTRETHTVAGFELAARIRR
jgi:DNA-binding beta-propeller fold protein YncE